MIRGIIGTALALVLAAVIYFAFVEPNIDDVQDTTKDAFDSITQTEPGKGGKRGKTGAERFARCVERDPTNVDRVKRCRARYLK